MPKYVIERDLPGAGELSAEELQEMAAKSNHVIGELGPEIRWLTSYVTDDKIYCVYIAPDEDILLEHARCGAFPADRISKVSTVIDHRLRTEASQPQSGKSAFNREAEHAIHST
ncbi:MAG: DUF4242 domain-containing protein [Solirubrobacteraceae bacterium]